MLHKKIFCILARFDVIGRYRRRQKGGIGKISEFNIGDPAFCYFFLRANDVERVLVHDRIKSEGEFGL